MALSSEDFPSEKIISHINTNINININNNNNNNNSSSLPAAGGAIPQWTEDIPSYSWDSDDD